jgi:type IV pilus assembly protein PilA
MSEFAPAPMKRYALPGWALALSLLGACSCVTAPAGLILGIVAVVRIHREPGLPGRGLAVAAILVAVLLAPMGAGVVAAIAVPNYLRFQARAKQAECTLNLRALWAKEVAFRVPNGHWASRFSEVGFLPAPGNRYAYVLSESEVIPVDARLPPPEGGATHLDALRRRGMALGVQGDDFSAACI